VKTQIRLIAATIPLTILIWVYADLSTHEQIEIRLPVRLVAPSGSGAVIHVEGAGSGRPSLKYPSDTVEVNVTLSGSKGAITELRQEMRREALAPLEVVVPAGEDEVGRLLHSVDLRDHVNDWARPRSLHVTDELSPRMVRYRVDRYVTIELTVEVDAGAMRDQLKGEPRVDPPVVKARLLASQREQLASADPRLRVSIESLLAANAEDEFEVSLAGLRWQGLELAYEPDRVVVTVERRHDYTRHRITAIPLYELWPAYRPEGRYRIEWEDGEPPLLHVEVMVPPGKPVMPTNQDVIAYVKIERGDLEAAPAAESSQTAPADSRTFILREVHLVFNDEFKDVYVPGPLPSVRFRIVRVP